MTTRLGNHGVRCKVAVPDWRAAIHAAGELMVASGGCEPSYVAAMEDGVVTYGPYIVIAPGVAIPHARPERGVLAQGTAVVTLAHGVDFGEESNDPVDLIIAFTAHDKESHLQTLQTLVAVLGDEVTLTRIRAATTEEQLDAALRRAETELTA
ncbi:PTS sugar transporter subunit IIA [Luethyella okanaganae]|uniref:Ascorbate-specific PTS system EIIA component n=1 Tax=Luethyella okanaganae TaxID=69372 RepID=A0ABW1VAR7_9MICO